MKYCKKCGAQLSDTDSFCPICGAAAETAAQTCPACGAAVGPQDRFCAICGAATGNNSRAADGPVYEGQVYNPKRRSKLVAGLLGIFVGGLGVHNFYLGKIGIGVIQIILTSLTCGLGSIWGFVEGILILCDQITVDGDGNPLIP